MRPKLSIGGVVHEALGFAILKFGNALRLAWLPIVLLMGLEAVAVKMGLATPLESFVKALRLEPGYTFKLVNAALSSQWALAAVSGIAVLLQASMATALIRFAADGRPPHHRSLHLTFGAREVKYIVACAASFAGVIMATKALLIAGYSLADANIIPVLNTEQAVFAPGSLHSVETEPAYGALRHLVQEVDAFYGRIGLNVSAIQSVVLIPVSLLAGYVLIRLLPLPFFAAARHAGDGYSSLGATLRLTGGLNIFPMLVIVLIFVILQVLTLGLLWLGLMIYGYAAMGTGFLIDGMENFAPNGPQGPLIRAFFSLISGLIVIFTTTFMVALNAGLGGALVHRGAR
ncbi:MAG: hypothetical protein ACWA5T_07280 [Parvularcula sp.]